MRLLWPGISELYFLGKIRWNQRGNSKGKNRLRVRMTSEHNTKAIKACTGSLPIVPSPNAIIMTSPPPLPLAETRDDGDFATAYLQLATQALRSHVAAPAQSLPLATEMMLVEHWPRAAALAAPPTNTPPAASAKCLTAALMLVPLVPASVVLIRPSPPLDALSGWIAAGVASAEPLWYSALMTVVGLHLAQPSHSTATDLVALLVTALAAHGRVSFFADETAAIQWLYFWSAAARKHATGTSCRVLLAALERVVLGCLKVSEEDECGGTGAAIAMLALAGVVGTLPGSVPDIPRPLTAAWSRLLCSPSLPVTVRNTTAFAMSMIGSQVPHYNWPARVVEAAEEAPITRALVSVLCTLPYALGPIIPTATTSTPAVPDKKTSPLDSLWPPLIGPLAAILGRYLRSAASLPATHLWAAETVTRALALSHAAISERVCADPASAKRDLAPRLFLAVMIGQDIAFGALPAAPRGLARILRPAAWRPALATSAVDASAAATESVDAGKRTATQTLLHLIGHLALIHPLTLALSSFDPNAPPFPSYSDHQTDLVDAAVRLRAVPAALQAALHDGPVSQDAWPVRRPDAAVAYTAGLISGDTRLLAHAPTAVLLQVAELATVPSFGNDDPIGAAAWEAAHWMLVRVLEAADTLPTGGPALGAAAREMWVWYAAYWWPVDPAPKQEQIEEPMMRHQVRWRATAALASSAWLFGEDVSISTWLVEQIAPSALLSPAISPRLLDAAVALPVAMNGIPLDQVPEAMRRADAVLECVERATASPGTAATKTRAWIGEQVMVQWDRAGGLRWDRHVALAQWWNGWAARLGVHEPRQ
ncbi:hypothetical protein BC828DRAFT_187651 [Blastocladiella britannica]|nr:hypothetical protein BC828DRAFT_187651 [Blastocladiella britannica]